MTKMTKELKKALKLSNQKKVLLLDDIIHSILQERKNIGKETTDWGDEDKGAEFDFIVEMIEDFDGMFEHFKQQVKSGKIKV